jgi:hypothetical protein
VLLPAIPGKTLLARALAQACSTCHRPVTFFARKGADVLSRFHGDAELTLRTLFEVAKRHAPSIIYFVRTQHICSVGFVLLIDCSPPPCRSFLCLVCLQDEIDGLTPVRSAKQNQVHASVVTTLLSLMDGLNSSGEVFVLASTNRVDSIDGALRRAGRFDREVYVGLPNQQQRGEILKIHTRAWPERSQLSPETTQHISVATVGFSGADLRALCSEAALLAAHRCIGPSLIHTGASSPTRSSDVLARLPEIDVTLDDLRAALAKIISSVRRHNGQTTSRTTATSLTILMEAKLTEAKNALDLPISIYNDQQRPESANAALVPDDAESDIASAPSSSSLSPLPLTLPSTVHRLLICGSGAAPESRTYLDVEGDLVQRPWRVSTDAHNPALLASSLIDALDLENCIVHNLDIPSLLLDDSALTLAEALVRKFQAAASGMTSNLFYLPRFDEWWSQTSIPSLQPLRGALITCLRNLTASTAASTRGQQGVCTVFLATTTCTRMNLQHVDSMHPFMLDFFRSSQTVAFVRPNSFTLKRFMQTALTHATRTLVKFLARCAQRGKISAAKVHRIEDVEQKSNNDAPSEAPAAASSADSSPRSAEMELDCSFSAFGETAASSITASVQPLLESSSSLEFIDLQRVQFDLDRWMNQECEAIGRATKHSKPVNEPSLRETFAQQQSATGFTAESWNAPLRHVVEALQRIIQQVTVPANTSLVDSTSVWTQLAQKHASTSPSNARAHRLSQCL